MKHRIGEHNQERKEKKIVKNIFLDSYFYSPTISGNIRVKHTKINTTQIIEYKSTKNRQLATYIGCIKVFYKKIITLTK